MTPDRVTSEQLDSIIADEYYHVVPDTTVTICVLKLVNGFAVVGHAACVKPENFNASTGRAVARSHAYEQLWALEGYLLREKLSQQGA